ncbi:Glycosyltransferase, catalytic subunit of cellulose synthase and poly-beta-1,6-N-acetylglucosamine synthase [Thalassobacillus cyri]|uniref:Glycosyltransferase, catalytic subunit of cellulose synthase and poly-beta-1,6-N-acetylglucosamine synthase n=1 Tax=Thalassobacillus cyri TaxID=571932 RepID=A0A1H3WGW3_9BACI|nr:glycosyltransferase [Thalassobacillus cyri]SDZ86345.1 Glycosyltransferase, catalytic subunit of cellulose synthase and poly-beta-1,6-N-acetylglucosamine synthase [Thalassobacillus cyri]
MDILITIFFLISVTFPVLHIYHCLPFFRESGERTDANRELKRWKSEHGYDMEKGISILVPCFNEEDIIETSVESMKSLSYSRFEVFYINDGSSDNTMDQLDELLDLTPSSIASQGELTYEEVKKVYQSSHYPNIYVIDKENGGKADSLNAGIEYATKDLVVTLDADTILTRTALNSVNEAFEDRNVVAAGGMVHVLQTKTDHPLSRLSLKNTNMLIRVQVLDFLKAFYISKLSLVRFKALAVISGAFGIFNKQVLIDVGGYRNSIGEDIDITLRIQRYIAKHKDMKISFIADAVGYTELPETWRDLTKQRLRWQKAYIDCIIHFWAFFLKTLLTKPVSFFYVFETFLIGTLAAYVMTGIMTYNIINNPGNSFIDYMFFYLFFLILFGIVYDLVALRMNKHYGFSFSKMDSLRLFVTILFDIFIYRFVAVYYVMYGSISYFFNKKWNKVSRTGRSYSQQTATGRLAKSRENVS